MLKKFILCGMIVASLCNNSYAQTSKYSDIGSLLNQKINKSSIGTANGVASLDSDATISANTVIANAQAKSRSLSSKFNDTIDVRDYGAKCDVNSSSTPTDDTTAIQTAINVAAGMDYVKVFLPGMCEVTSAITATIPNHIKIEGGGLYVNGTSTTDGLDLTVTGKIIIDTVKFKAGTKGAGFAAKIIGNGSSISDNSDYFNNISITTNTEKADSIGFSNGLYLYGLVAFVNNFTTTMQQIDKSTSSSGVAVRYTTPDVGNSIELAGTPSGSTSPLNGGGSIITNVQANGGFSTIRIVGLVQGGVFSNWVSNWQTHIVYSGTDVVSPQSLQFFNMNAQSGFWSENDAIIFDFENGGGQYLISGGTYSSPGSSAAWSILKCYSCASVQFLNNAIDERYSSTAYLIDSGPSGGTGTSWNVSGNILNVPSVASSLGVKTNTFNFAGLSNAKQLTFTNNDMGNAYPIVPPPLKSGTSNNLITSESNNMNNIQHINSAATINDQRFTQGPISTSWNISTTLEGSSSLVANGVLTLTLDNNTESASNALSTIRPFNSPGAIVFYDAMVHCYEWASNPAKYFSTFRVNGVFDVTPGGTDTYTLVSQSSTPILSSYASSEAFTGRFVLSSTTASPALQVVNSGTTQESLTCTANIQITNMR